MIFIHSKYPTVLTEEANQFICELVETFSDRVKHILQERQIRQLAFDNGAIPSFSLGTGYIRQGSWKIAPVPKDIQDRRVEITVPANDRKMVINALNSKSQVCMCDFEDACSPTFDNIMQGQTNLMDAVRRTISFTNQTGKQYQLNPQTAVLFVRPRGWHLIEKHFIVNATTPAPAALFDFGLYFFHNAQELINRGTAPYFYLPKMESHLEARLWNDVFVWAQDKLNIPQGTIKATCLIETLPAAFEMDEILFELKDHSAGLNVGRYDYMFSFIKKFAENHHYVLPNRSQLTMDKKFLASYCKLLVQTCHKRGAHAIGGMSNFIPSKSDPEENKLALEKVRADKLREVNENCDGAWVAHPGLVSIVRTVFDEHMPTPNQVHMQNNEVITAHDLLTIPEGDFTEIELRRNIRVGIQYIEAWLRGVGCVPLYGLMEDLATCQISIAQIWQWLRHKVPVSGTIISNTDFLQTVNEEMKQIELETGEHFTSGRFDEAKKLFTDLCTKRSFEEFLTTPAYDLLD